MSPRNRPTRWSSIRRAHRIAERWRSTHRHRGGGTGAWARILGHAGATLSEPVCGSLTKSRTSRPPGLTAVPPGCGGQGSEPAFVELVPALPAGPAECTLELAEPSGRKLTISLRGAPGPDLLALAQSLWGMAR
jgi:hypothetical protein